MERKGQKRKKERRSRTVGLVIVAVMPRLQRVLANVFAFMLSSVANVTGGLLSYCRICRAAPAMSRHNDINEIVENSCPEQEADLEQWPRLVHYGFLGGRLERTQAKQASHVLG